MSVTELDDLRARYESLTDAEHERLCELDLTGALCLLVKSAGLTMTLYGQPVGEVALKTFCTVKRDAELARALIDAVNDP